MAKRVFIAFASEDKSARDLLKGQALNTKSPFEYIDMSVKEPYNTEWKTSVRTRIRGCDGVIALVSTNTGRAAGQKWEIECANQERKRLIGVWAYRNDKWTPEVMAGKRIIPWTWQGIADFLNTL